MEHRDADPPLVGEPVATPLDPDKRALSGSSVRVLGGRAAGALFLLVAAMSLDELRSGHSGRRLT